MAIKEEEEKSAKGVTGFIMFHFVTNEPFFRVYDHGKKDKHGSLGFIDYEICHDDLQVVIQDGMAVFSTNKDGKPCITYRNFDPSKPHTITYKGSKISKEEMEKIKRDKGH